MASSGFSFAVVYKFCYILILDMSCALTILFIEPCHLLRLLIIAHSILLCIDLVCGNELTVFLDVERGSNMFEGDACSLFN